MGKENLNAIMDIIDDALKTDDLSLDELHALNDHVIRRAKSLKQQVGAEIGMSLRTGTKVRISQKSALRPRYILGTEAEVYKVNQTTATIKLGKVNSPDGQRGRFYSGQMINCPLDALELVKEVSNV